jgi:hypothetical protein
MLLLPYLEQLPELQLTADLSHWCCACESLLEDQPHTLATTLPHVRHIHARVGHPQGPQVADFRAPEAQAALEAHLSWWDEVIRLRRAAGAEYMTLTPEFGPVPYTQTLPYTQQEVSNAWELNGHAGACCASATGTKRPPDRFRRPSAASAAPAARWCRRPASTRSRSSRPARR